MSVFAYTRNAQRQGDVVEGRQVIDKTEILEHHAHPAAIGGQPLARQRNHIGAEHADRAPRRALREI